MQLPSLNERSILCMSKNQARNVLDGKDKNFTIVKNKHVKTQSLCAVYELVIQRKSDNRYFRDTYEIGRHQCYDDWEDCKPVSMPWEDESPQFVEVFPVTKTHTYIEYE